MAKHTLLCVDPGINLGLSVLEVDRDTRNIKVLDARTSILNDIAKHYYEELLDNQGIIIARIIVIEDLIKKYGEYWCPDFIIHETAFSAHGRRFGGSIESFASLRENILGIRLAACKFDQSIPVVSVNPSTVKYCVVGAKSDDKDQIKKGLKTKSNIDLSEVDLDSLDQHAIDAIAIGYTFVQKQYFGVSENETKRAIKTDSGKKAKRVKSRGSG